jgi:hypothetical protein
MRPGILVRHIFGCPGLELLQQRLAAISKDQADLKVVFELVATDEEALSLGFCGSPTVLINGRDPFAVEGATPGLSCRLYATGQGIEPAPSLGQLREALTSNRRP